MKIQSLSYKILVHVKIFLTQAKTWERSMRPKRGQDRAETQTCSAVLDAITAASRKTRITAKYFLG